MNYNITNGNEYEYFDEYENNNYDQNYNGYMDNTNYYVQDNNASNYNNSYINDNVVQFNYFGATDIGKVSDLNEDIVNGFTLLNDEVMCLVAIDGLGSVRGGQISSVVALDELKNYLTKFLHNSTLEHMKEVLYAALYSTNRVVSNYMRINPEIYSSFTAAISVILVNKNKEMILGHVGNTRLYILREGAIYQITRDDTIARDLVDSNEITEDEYRVHPDRGRLNKFLGDPTLEPFINSGTVQKEDLLLLCTNGLYEMVTDEGIKEIVYNTGNSKDACEKLIEVSNELGGIDNIGVLISYIDF